MPALFGVVDGPAVEPRYNIAPTQRVAVVRCDAEGRRTVAMLRWGLVPFWAKDPAIGNRLINARAETAAEKPAFRAAWRRRRCLVPADGFYEWQAGPAGKTPYFISAASGEPFAMAGLWEHWEPKNSEDALMETFTILTTAPTDLMARLHNRMPVVLGQQSSEAWLAGGDLERAGDSLADPAVTLRAWPVSRKVNSPRNEDASLIEPEGAELDAG